MTFLLPLTKGQLSHLRTLPTSTLTGPGRKPLQLKQVSNTMWFITTALCTAKGRPKTPSFCIYVVEVLEQSQEYPTRTGRH